MRKIFLSAAFLALNFASMAQVGVGTDDPKATLDVVADAATATAIDGIIPPRLTGDQLRAKTNYGSDQEGVMVYVTAADTAPEGKTINVTEKGFYYFDSVKSTWMAMVARGAGDGNNTAGNAGIGTAYGEVVSATGKVWLDRNLGALQVATSATDKDAMGDLYQWGRAADGHQVVTRTNGDNTDALTEVYAGEASNSNAVIGINEWDGKHINSATLNWLATPENTLWSVATAENNPCPSGFRVPTVSEFTQEVLTWSSFDDAGAFGSPLKISNNGWRNSSGSFHFKTISMNLWTSTVNAEGTAAYRFSIYSEDGSLILPSLTPRSVSRSFGVRCIKH